MHPEYCKTYYIWITTFSNQNSTELGGFSFFFLVCTHGGSYDHFLYTESGYWILSIHMPYPYPFSPMRASCTGVMTYTIGAVCLGKYWDTVLPTALLNGCRHRSWRFCVLGKNHAIILHHCQCSGREMCERYEDNALLFWNRSQSFLMQYGRSQPHRTIEALCSHHYQHRSSPAWPAIPYPDFYRDCSTILLQLWDHHTHPVFSLLFPPKSAWAYSFSNLCEQPVWALRRPDKLTSKSKIRC